MLSLNRLAPEDERWLGRGLLLTGVGVNPSLASSIAFCWYGQREEVGDHSTDFFVLRERPS